MIISKYFLFLARHVYLKLSKISHQIYYTKLHIHVKIFSLQYSVYHIQFTIFTREISAVNLLYIEVRLRYTSFVFHHHLIVLVTTVIIKFPSDKIISRTKVTKIFMQCFTFALSYRLAVYSIPSSFSNHYNYFITSINISNSFNI